MRLRSWSLTDIGRKRDHNEDSYLADEGLGLYAVADGMGGHQGGDRASRMAVDVLAREVAALADFDAGAREIQRLDPLVALLTQTRHSRGASLRKVSSASSMSTRLECRRIKP